MGWFGSMSLEILMMVAEMVSKTSIINQLIVYEDFSHRESYRIYTE
jgi:hypothetical protein